jgi:hypothetical protein
MGDQLYIGRNGRMYSFALSGSKHITVGIAFVMILLIDESSVVIFQAVRKTWVVIGIVTISFHSENRLLNARRIIKMEVNYVGESH